MAIRSRNDPVRLFGRRLLLLALLGVIVVAALGAWNAYGKERESRALREQAEMQLSDLSKRQAQLESDIANLETDRGKEQVLREQYALAARGEGLIVIVDAPKATPTQATSSVLEWLRKALPWW
ncbi:hypothetical protein HY971_04400 [Candidatus Kaiserbacteria bacterium]|nr:hypothetical protein [Candidatus Kaiserbacteria bacterium]